MPVRNKNSRDCRLLECHQSHPQVCQLHVDVLQMGVNPPEVERSILEHTQLEMEEHFWAGTEWPALKEWIAAS